LKNREAEDAGDERPIQAGPAFCWNGFALRHGGKIPVMPEGKSFLFRAADKKRAGRGSISQSGALRSVKCRRRRKKTHFSELKLRFPEFLSLVTPAPAAT
jgi:hypothetical protein